MRFKNSVSDIHASSISTKGPKAEKVTEFVICPTKCLSLFSALVCSCTCVASMWVYHRAQYACSKGVDMQRLNPANFFLWIDYNDDLNMSTISISHLATSK